MEVVRRVYVIGMRPAYTLEVNNFMKNLDLGVEGMYKKFNDGLTLELDTWPLNKTIIDKQIPTLKNALESQGWKSIQLFDLGFFKKTSSGLVKLEMGVKES